jgi:hypothetical protein
MTLAIVKVTGADTTFGNKKIKIRDVTFDSSYPTGGEPLTAADVGLKRIDQVLCDAGAKNAAGTLVIPVRYDHANAKLQGYEYNGAAAGVARLQELANTFDASAFTARITFIGY